MGNKNKRTENNKGKRALDRYICRLYMKIMKKVEIKGYNAK